METIYETERRRKRHLALGFRVDTTRGHTREQLLLPHSAVVNMKHKRTPTMSSPYAPIVLLLVLANCVHLSLQQSSISLNTAQWFVSNSNGSLVLPAQVPGGIYSDLRRNNVLKQELLYGRNDLAYRWVGQENWTYTTSFAIDQQIAVSQSVKLLLHGVDTVSTVYLNGEEIGTTDNMFVRYKFDVKPYLKLAGLKNILVIKFESPIKYAARRSHQNIRQNKGKIIPPYCPSPAQRGECHVNFIRKMQASFSWDWGPAFPSMGIYKNIELEFGSFGVIRDILVETRRLGPLVQPTRQPMAPPQVIISSTIKHNVRIPTVNKSVPYMRAPPYYVPFNEDGESFSSQLPDSFTLELPQRVQLIETNQRLQEETWLLKTTLVAEMVQPSFGYNVRIEFNLNGVLHYESEHINVVANSDGFIRLGFNLRIDTSRMRIKPWWPNNAGSQTLYRLSARMMPIPSPPEQTRLYAAVAAAAATAASPLMALNSNQLQSLQARAKPLQTPAVPAMIFLATPPDASAHVIQTVSEKEISFGFRTIELIQEPVTLGTLDDGLTFNFRVNGIDLFAMGSNWIPSSVLPENSNDLEYVRYLLQSAKDANMNMLRVWGGGLYESDEFYQMADQMGIMIWHDFMFACALYPIDDDFIASVRLEIEQQVQRLQHHPSIVLWAGNNENEMAIAGPWWPEVMLWNKKLREAYEKLYADTIRPIVQVLDPTRPYLESSPSNGLLSENQPNRISRHPNDNKYGDVHHYDYLTDAFDWSVYPSTRFASEYGYQSYPSFNALTSIAPQSDWKYPLTANILHRQHRLTGETEMKLQMKVHFNELKSGGEDKLKTFIYVSQLTQAIAIKTETEFYRRNRFIDPETKLGKTMGALYWQLNDVWQAPTWSSIEYGGKWKMLHYFARRFFFPIQVMPYVVQPSPSFGNSIQQAIASGSAVLSSLTGQRLASATQSANLNLDSFQAQQKQSQQQQPSSSPLFVIDLVRDDLFELLHSFNVTIRFFRWTSFSPVWQDTVYVRNTQPQNVTRIYEQEMTRIVRQPGVISLSSGVFQVVIEQQPRLGLSQIENYLMPVAPNRVTAMRVAKINVELIQGPFELTDVRAPVSAQGARYADPHMAGAGGGPSSSVESTQWACAYRLTLVSDSIAMFVWLDLNLLNVGGASGEANQAAGVQQDGPGHQDRARPPASIHLDALPSAHGAAEQAAVSHSVHALPPEHIRLHLNNRDQTQPHVSRARPPADLFETSASETVELKQQDARAPEKPLDHSNEPQRRQRRERQLNAAGPADRPVLNTGGEHQNQPGGSEQPASAGGNWRERLRPPQTRQPPFKPVDAAGGQMLRYQFSDNAFNMFEPSKVIDLYLSRCLSKAQIEVGLEIESLADCL